MRLKWGNPKNICQNSDSKAALCRGAVLDVHTTPFKILLQEAVFAIFCVICCMVNCCKPLKMGFFWPSSFQGHEFSKNWGVFGGRPLFFL